MRWPRLSGGRRGALFLALAVVAIAVAATLANLALLDRAADVNAPLGELRQAGATTAAPATPPAIRTEPAPAVPERVAPPPGDSDDRDRDRDRDDDREDRARDDRGDRDREDD